MDYFSDAKVGRQVGSDGNDLSQHSQSYTPQVRGGQLKWPGCIKHLTFRFKEVKS